MKPKPVIKWSGSKRSQAEEIVSHFPDKIRYYYEPFCGGCSVARTLMESGKNVQTYILSDANPHLINALNEIKWNYEKVVPYYTMMWEALAKIPNIRDKEEFYLKLRDKFNDGQDPWDFIVLNRLCYNGLIRYNSKGEFNTSYHFNRDGIRPDKFQEILEDWHRMFNIKDVHFVCADYKTFNFTYPSDGQFIYMDPPYANTKGMYNSTFSKEEFFDFLRTIKGSYAFSYNGKSGNKDQTVDIPEELYTEHYYIKSGNSSFKRLKSDKGAVVYESLYLKEWKN